MSTKTTVSPRRLVAYLAKSGDLKRSRIANFLGLTLIVLTISVGGAGYYTYRSLSEVVQNLEVDQNPGENLLLYKDILVSLQGLDNLVETYQLSEEVAFRDRYVQTNDRVLILIDSLNRKNAHDREMIIYNDSLRSLVLKNKQILDQLLDYVNKSETEGMSADLNQVVKNATSKGVAAEKTPIESIDSDEKDGILKRLFSKKEREILANQPELNSDSLLEIQKAEIQQELNQQIARIRQNAIRRAEKKRKEEIALEMEHFDLQNQLFDLIGFLESRETVKVQITTLRAQGRAAKTNQQISIFFWLATLLLLISLFIMVVYVRRNRAYQKLLHESKEAAETLSKAKERFFANMSHELRTPLNAIFGFSKILVKTKLPPQQQEQMEIIHKSSEHLLGLINDILDFSKLQAEKLRLEQVPFDIKEIAEDCVAMLAGTPSQKGLKLHFEGGDLPKSVLGDPGRLRQILLNLLANAIKYTESGAVTLALKSEKIGHLHKVHFSVKDTGIGIPADQQHKLFREFEQANQSSLSQGTGLGLAITRRLVLLHQGSIDIESKMGVGTEVRFSIPYVTAEPILKDTKSSQKQMFHGLHILLADDEPFNIKLLATLLDQQGIKHDEAENGEQAYQLAQVKPYDLIILDLKMPKMTGWEVASRIRHENGPNTTTPMIALTATLDKDENEVSQKAGFDSVMRKPFDEHALFELIASKTKSSTPEKTLSNINSILKMGGKKFAQEMIETYQTSSQKGLEELYQFLEKRDFVNLSLTAHRLVAPARHFKADTLTQRLKSLEINAQNERDAITPSDIDAIKEELHQVIESLFDQLYQKPN